MKKYAYVVLAAIALVLVGLGLAGSASAVPPAQTEHSAQHRALAVDDAQPGPAAGPAAPSGGRADLPSGDGPNKVFLLSGLVLLLAGATAVTVARRNAEEVELPGQTA